MFKDWVLQINYIAGVTGVNPTLVFAVFYEFASDLVGVLI